MISILLWLPDFLLCKICIKNNENFPLFVDVSTNLRKDSDKRNWFHSNGFSKACKAKKQLNFEKDKTKGMEEKSLTSN